MSVKKKITLRIFHIIGLLLGFISLFMDWYYFTAVDEFNEKWVDWTYHLFLGWFSPLNINTSFNDYFRPVNGEVPLLITIIFIVFLLFSSYTVISKDAESSDIARLNPYAFFNLGYILFLSFYIVIFPIFYLMPNQLIFPYFPWYNIDLELAFTYIIGPGYIMQFFAFMCSLPYTLFFYHVIRTFEEDPNATALTHKLQKTQIPLDLDRLIAEEELILTSVPEHQEDHVEQAYQKFLTIKKRRLQ